MSCLNFVCVNHNKLSSLQYLCINKYIIFHSQSSYTQKSVVSVKLSIPLANKVPIKAAEYLALDLRHSPQNPDRYTEELINYLNVFTDTSNEVVTQMI